MCEKDSFWISLKEIRKRYIEGLIPKSEYLITFIQLSFNELSKETIRLEKDSLILYHIRKEVNKNV